MRAGQAGGPAADHRDAPARRRRTREGIALLLHQVIDGVALEHADIDRLVLRGVAHALVLAQDLGRADARAHPAKDIGFEDLLRRTLRVAGVDHADEVRNVDRGWARLDAGRIMAEIAAAAFDQRLLAIERRLDVLEIRGDFVRPQTSGGDVRRCRLRHQPLPWVSATNSIRSRSATRPLNRHWLNPWECAEI